MEPMKYLDEKAAAEMISAMLQKLPESFSDVNARRDEIRRATASFDPDTSIFAASVYETIRLLRMRAEQFRVDVGDATVEGVNGDPATAPTMEIPEPEVTRPLPPEQQPAPEVPSEPDDAARWTDRERLLYRDIIHLFELGDHAGAMASLERLFMLLPGADELSVFLGKNESTLLRLYRGHLGSMDRVPVPSKAKKQVRIPTPDADLMLRIIRMSDGHRPLRDFVKKSEAPELHVLIVISHLVRSGYLELA